MNKWHCIQGRLLIKRYGAMLNSSTVHFMINTVVLVLFKWVTYYSINFCIYLQKDKFLPFLFSRISSVCFFNLLVFFKINTISFTFDNNDWSTLRIWYWCFFIIIFFYNFNVWFCLVLNFLHKKYELIVQ